MTKKEMAFYLIVSMTVFCLIGYVVGAMKVALFDSTGDGQAIVRVCDVDGEWVDENNRCRNFTRIKISYAKARKIATRRWAGYGAGAGFLIFFGVGSAVENKQLKRKKESEE
jgi:hypothetical protein